MVPGSTEGQEDASCHALLTEGCQGEGLAVGAVRRWGSMIWNSGKAGLAVLKPPGPR